MKRLKLSFTIANFFSNIDLEAAYNQLRLEEESQKLTAFYSPIGVLQFARLNFGAKSAPEIFQKIMNNVFGDIKFVWIYLDDIAIAAPTRQEHDKALEEVERRIAQYNFKKNEAKCSYRQSSMTFLGYVIDKNGVRISPDRYVAIKELSPPSNVKGVHSVLGFFGFLRGYIKNFAEKTVNLREIIRAKSFDWSEEAQNEFVTLKKELLNSFQQNVCLAHFNPKRETRLYTDASDVGIGGVLIQKDKDGKYYLISCIGRTLTETEQKYPTVEKEALAVFYAVKRFYYCLIGTQFAIYTDNEAVKVIYGKAREGLTKKAVNRLNSYALTLASYDCEFRYVSSEDNVADVLSRYCRIEDKLRTSRIDNPYEVKDLCVANTRENNYGPLAFEKIQRESQSDEILVLVRNYIEFREENEKLKEWNHYMSRLSTEFGVVWYEDRIVIPETLKKIALQVAHEGHPGMSAMKRKLRGHVWWPRINNDVEKFVRECDGCVLVTKGAAPEPLLRTVLPDRPWEKLASDFFEVPTENLKILTLVDYYSRFLKVSDNKMK